MEFDLEQIRRDWIEGVSEAELLEEFEAARRCLIAVPERSRMRGAVLCERNPVEFAAVFFAAVSLRVPVVLANPNWGQQEWREFFGLVAPTVGFGVPGTTGTGDAGFTPLRSEATLGGASEAPPAWGLLKAGTIMIPTGGTTGGVKLAVHDWASLAAACEGVRSFLGGGPIDSCCVLPLYHVSGLMQLLRAYHSGGRIRFDADDVAGRCLSYVPTQLQRVLADSQRVAQLAQARAIFVGGAALTEDLANKARELKLPIVPVYGMTETAAMVAAIPSKDFLVDSGAGAVALGETRFSIGGDGQICIQSAALFKGYVGREPLDLVDGYWTGDAGFIDTGGCLHVLGRMDRLINSGGEKIDPREVESVFCRLEGVEAALVVGVPDAEWGQRLVVYYTGRRMGNWKAELKNALAKYKIPKEALWVAALPLDEK